MIRQLKVSKCTFGLRYGSLFFAGCVLYILQNTIKRRQFVKNSIRKLANQRPSDLQDL